MLAWRMSITNKVEIHHSPFVEILYTARYPNRRKNKYTTGEKKEKKHIHTHTHTYTHIHTHTHTALALS